MATFGAADGTGPDIVFLTNRNMELDLRIDEFSLAPPRAYRQWRIDRNAIISTLCTASGAKAFRAYGQRSVVPFSWGTHAIVYDTNERDYAYGKADWEHLWAPENQGRVAIEPAWR